MKHVDFDPARLTGDQAEWWRRWQQRADAATIEAIDAWERGGDVAFNETIWRDLKEWLLDNVFSGKCAYCETSAPRYPGHAEHFRPKGRVDDYDPQSDRWAPASVEWPDGRVAPHPGYFWLAYNWKNLLPACQGCNSGRAKQNKFPVTPGRPHALVPRLSSADAARLAAHARESVKWGQRYYLDPDALDELESPMLLNPYIDNPRRHLRFGRGGIITAIENDPKAERSIRVLNLDDDKLNRDRQKAQTKALMVYRMHLSRHLLNAGEPPSVGVQAAYEELTDYHAGREEYSVAALDYVDMDRAELSAAFQGHPG